MFEIEEHDVRSRGQGKLDRIDAVLGEADDLDPRIALKESGRALSHQPVVVGDHHAHDGARGSAPSQWHRHSGPSIITKPAV